MRLKSLAYLVCPVCLGGLELSVDAEVDSEVSEGSLRCRGCNREYSIIDDIPDFTYPHELHHRDLKVMKQYDDGLAEKYDQFGHALAEQIGVEEEALWEWKRSIVNKLQLKGGEAVLDVSCGTGTDLVQMAEQVGEDGLSVGLDLSWGMLRMAQRKLKQRGAEADLYRGNAAYLPFKDETFDALLHVGGLNTFGEKERAIQEMFRTTKDVAKLVVSDEGLAPGMEKTEFGKDLLNQNSYFAFKPPLNELLIDGLRKMKVEWPMKGAFYVVEVEKST